MSKVDLQKVYAAEFACLDNLATLLEEERVALRARNTVKILATSEQKQDLIEQLESLDTQRRALKKKVADIYSNNTDFIEYIAINDRKLKHTLNTFQHANRINLGIVELGRIFTEQLLSILRGQSQHTSEVYDPTGNRQNSILSKSLAKV